MNNARINPHVGTVETRVYTDNPIFVVFNQQVISSLTLLNNIVVHIHSWKIRIYCYICLTMCGKFVESYSASDHSYLDWDFLIVLRLVYLHECPEKRSHGFYSKGPKGEGFQTNVRHF